MMNHLKLGVEVISAHDLIPKEKNNLSSAFVELHFDGQKFRTTTKENDLNPVWNESFYFNISDPHNLANLNLEAYVYHYNKDSGSKYSLGKVCLTGTSFVPFSDAVELHYPLEKKGIFSRVKGAIGLRVFVTDDPSIRPSNSLPVSEPILHPDLHSSDYTQGRVQHVPNSASSTVPNVKSSLRHTFRHLSNPNQPQQPNFPSSETSQAMKYKPDEMKVEPQASRFYRMFTGPPQPTDYELKETSPFLGGGQVVRGRVIGANRRDSTYDLVEKMKYLFVRVVKARELPHKDVTGSLDPYVEVKIGNYKGLTRHFQKKQNPEWNEVFAFAKDNLQSSVLEVVLMDKDTVLDDFVGVVRFDLNEVPTRVPPDSPLAPEWYRLEDKKKEKKSGEVMLAVWYGTQADEAFADAWHSDTITPTDSSSAISVYTRSKVYHSPRLWYVRVNVIEAQDLTASDRSRIPHAYVKVQLGNQVLKTRAVQAQALHASWNEDLMFVAAEPFEEHLVLSVEDRTNPNKDETIGEVTISLTNVERRADDRPIKTRWHNILKNSSAITDVEKEKRDNHKFASRLHLRVCLDGGYHVLYESTQYSSDLRPSAKQLWKPAIGVLELGILGADGLHPKKTRDNKGTSDTFCVAKYGQKWVRTRTIIDSLSPKYNEQYTWEVHDPATVLSVAVFENNQIGGSNSKEDMKIGKVRIRISTLETGRVYTHSYPLLVLHRSGVKKMGELHLAIRFTCTSMMDLMYKYSRPLLPKMHYKRPLSMIQQDMLRHQAVNVVAARLSRAEPPLKREVVEYMTDADSHIWSMRRSKANFFRLMSIFSGLFAVGKWLGEVCKWKNPITTVLMHVLYLMLVCFPELILPTAFLYMFVIGLWNFRFRPRQPPHMNTRISHADAVLPDELLEEFDTFPTSESSEIVRRRYDRLRIVAGRIQSVVGDIATQAERVEALLSWRDPRATTMFVIFCLLAAFVLYVTPFQVLALFVGFYAMRHPKFRQKTPAAPLNFFRRLPAKTDLLL